MHRDASIAKLVRGLATLLPLIIQTIGRFGGYLSHKI
jgi:hypothetical protein